MPIRFLGRAEVAGLLTVEACRDAIERAFRAQAEGRTLGPAILGLPATDGGFHVKAAGLRGDRGYVAVKVNGNFPDNPRRRGRPAIQGVVVLAEADTGTPLAVMDSMEITARRTAATTALAARWLARPGPAVATIVGCGVQGRHHARALARTLPLERIWLHDLEPSRAETLAAELEAELGLPVAPAPELRSALAASQVGVTCTPARAPLLGPGDLPPGLFLAAVGADSEDKQELEPEVLAGAAVVVDHLEQCAAIGELHHALARGLMTRAQVRAELWEVVTGRRPGRRTAGEVVVFDSTGTALQDVAAAVAVWEAAGAGAAGLDIDL